VIGRPQYPCLQIGHHLGENFESAPIEMKILATILRMTIERVSIELKILAIILRVTPKGVTIELKILAVTFEWSRC
jgi:hypothetical protein